MPRASSPERYEGDTACDGDLKRVSDQKRCRGTLLAIDGLKSHIIRKDAGTVPAIERFLHDLLQTSEGHMGTLLAPKRFARILAKRDEGGDAFKSSDTRR